MYQLLYYYEQYQELVAFEAQTKLDALYEQYTLEIQSNQNEEQLYYFVQYFVEQCQSITGH
ncbi:MAG TPA: hypothetical protein PLR16_01710 [Bacilli bacterium]|nr:hypothetical protein [Bacilli bacterium]